MLRSLEDKPRSRPSRSLALRRYHARMSALARFSNEKRPRGLWAGLCPLPPKNVPHSRRRGFAHSPGANQETARWRPPRPLRGKQYLCHAPPKPALTSTPTFPIEFLPRAARQNQQGSYAERCVFPRQNRLAVADPNTQKRSVQSRNPKSRQENVVTFPNRGRLAGASLEASRVLYSQRIWAFPINISRIAISDRLKGSALRGNNIGPNRNEYLERTDVVN